MATRSFEEGSACHARFVIAVLTAGVLGSCGQATTPVGIDTSDTLTEVSGSDSTSADNSDPTDVTIDTLTEASGPDGTNAEVDPADCSDEVSQRVCGLNDRGGQYRECLDGTWGPWSTCDDPDTCADGSSESRPCSNGVGSVEQICVDGQWSGFPECDSPQHVLIISDGYDGYMEPCVATYVAAEIPVTQANSLPDDLSPYRLVFVNNPNSGWFTPADAVRLKEMVALERRIVLLGDHCKLGCFVDENTMNMALGTLGFEAIYSGSIGVSHDPATVLTHPLTAGVETLGFDWSGGLAGMAPAIEPLAMAGAGEVLVAVQRPSYSPKGPYGDVVVVADMDFFLFADVSTVDNSQFLMNLWLIE